MQINIVLLGKTGHGKSATGNTLLCKDHFEELASPLSKTKMIERCSSVYEDNQMHVFDMPGPFETKLSSDLNYCDEELLCNNMNMLMGRCSDDGISAFFFVHNIRGKYTEEDIKTMEMLKTIFGEDAILKFGILIFTHGDNFKHDFQTWCKAQSGEFGELINSFGERVLLITNSNSKPEERTKARARMIQMAKEIHGHGEKYKQDRYKKAEKSRELMIFHAKLEKQFTVEIKDLGEEIEERDFISTTTENNLKEIIGTLKNKIINERKGTNKLDKLIKQLDDLTLIVSTKHRDCYSRNPYLLSA